MRASIHRCVNIHRNLFLAAAIGAIAAAVAPPVHAALYTYTESTSNTAAAPDEWSAGTDWLPTAPGSASDTTLTFTGTLGSAGTVFTNDDIAGDFFLNQFNFTYAGPATGTAPTVTISGNPLRFIDDGVITPVLTLAATGVKTPLLVVSNNLTLDNSLQIAAGSNATLSGVIADGAASSGLTLTGTGTVIVGSANTYSGATTLDGGVLQVGALADVDTASGIGTGSVAGSAGDLVFGGGTLRFNGSAATSTDRLFTIGDANGNSATLDASGTVVSNVIATMNFTNTGSIAFGTTGAHTLTLTGSTPLSNVQSFNTFAPVVGDAGLGSATTVDKTGATSFWDLAGANTYSGGTDISGGTLESGTAGGFGSGDVTVASGASVWPDGAGTYANNFFIAGTGVSTKFGGVGGLLGAMVIGPSVVLSGTITLNADAMISTSTNVTATATNGSTISGQITGAYSVTFGSGMGLHSVDLTISDPANDYTGSTTLQGELGRAWGGANSGGEATYHLGADEVIPDGSSVTMAMGDGAADTLDLNGHTETIDALISSGAGRDTRRIITNVSAANSAATLIVGSANGSGTFLGHIQDGSATKTVALTKIGTGTETLTGNETQAGLGTFSGATTITGGTLAIDVTQFASAAGAAVNYFSTASPVVLNGGTLAITGQTAGSAVSYATTAAINSYTITLPSTAGLVVGQAVTGAAIPAGDFIAEVNSPTTVTLETRTTAANTDFNTSATTGSTSQTFKSLDLAASSTIDFGTSGNVVLTFGSVTQSVDGTVLTINNWVGTPDTLGGSDQLLFTGATTDFTSQFSQSEVYFTGYGLGYAALDTGAGTYEIVPNATPVPEPASLALLGLGAAALLARKRRS